MGKLNNVGETIKPEHGALLSIIGYLQLSIIVAIIVLAILGNWFVMTIFIGVLICILIFTYRYFTNILTKGGLQDE